MRDVGDEVAADLIDAPELRDVVQHEDDAVRDRAGCRRRRGQDGPRRVARRGKLQRFPRPPGEHAPDQRRDRRQTDRLDVGQTDGRLLQLKHLPRRVVDELQPSLRIDDDDALGHAGEDRFHASPVTRLLRKLPPDFLDRFVQRARDRAQLVVAEPEPGRRQVALSIPVRDLRDQPHASTDARGQQPRDDGAAQERQTERRERRGEDRLKLVPDVGQRERHANEADGGMFHRHRDVQHVDLHRRAVAARAAKSGLPRGDDLRPLSVVLHGGDAVERFGRIAQHAAVRRDERDARANQLTETIRLFVWLRDVGERRAAREEIGGQPRFRDERGLDALVDLPAHRRRKQRAGDPERNDCGGKGREEELRLKRGAAEGRRHGAGSTSL